MTLDSLLDTILAGPKRKQEIVVENKSDYEKWESKLWNEIGSFVKMVNDLDLEDSEDRDRLFDLVDKYFSRFQNLRERNEASMASVETLIELDTLVELMENTSGPAVISSRTSLKPDPFKRAREEERKKKREQNRIERAREKRSEIANHIQRVISSLQS